MTSNYFLLYIAVYTVTAFLRYLLRRHATKASTLESQMVYRLYCMALYHSLTRRNEIKCISKKLVYTFDF